ncbi:hypothetical protein GCM10010441_44250 [Kitasatospora paracochleata]|uniref:Uncharacterized protein n=1 Tax=Kitasatospora paracochleata TaxID=58354 RepID=A0ABT1IVU8_9ACTN|nr:hypothetical protein [Kitasatospora paracochleata]MCP2309184.1 hypothetical protein [Kitasatospora paracochleata]
MAEFTNRRSITSAQELTPVQVEQVRLCGLAYDGEDLPAGCRLGADGDDEETVLSFCEVWDVVADGAARYEAWFYQVDSGSVFLAGTTEMVAEIIQCGLQCADAERRTELGTAMVTAGLLPASDSAYQEFLHARG